MCNPKGMRRKTLSCAQSWGQFERVSGRIRQSQFRMADRASLPRRAPAPCEGAQGRGKLRSLEPPTAFRERPAGR
eukprot:6938440-Pyramimonas_sp.AAC.1